MVNFDGWAEFSKGESCVQCKMAHTLGRMLAQLDNVSARGLRDDGFTQAQALWQESDASVVLGTLRNSSLLKDERNSGLNALLTAELGKGRWAQNISLFEVNDVCDGGHALLAALRRQASLWSLGRMAS